MRSATAAWTVVILLAGGLSAASARVAAAAWGTQANATASFSVGTFAGTVPQLVKSFDPAVQTAGQPVRLVITIYNSSPARDGYIGSFADMPPTGMQIANPSDFAITCPQGSGNAVPGTGNSISFSFALTAATASCTVSANVTGTAGTYTNSAANITQYGVSPALPVTGATVTFR